MTFCIPLPQLPASQRADTETLKAQFSTFVGTHCRDFFDALPNMILGLNAQRQIVFANTAALKFFSFRSIEQALGLRPGEAAGCVNADIVDGGCGNSRHCRNCAALAAILNAIEGNSDTCQVNVIRRSHTHLEGIDLQVDASPVIIGVESYVVFAITDISHEVRRRSMEQIFFHDVLNLAGGIRGLTEILKDSVPETCSMEMGILHSAMESLVDEILAQRELTAAENGELVPDLKPANSLQLMQSLVHVYTSLPVARGRILAVAADSEDIDFVADGRLLQRVLGNMLKNALEAEEEGVVITLRSWREQDSLLFSVHNPGFIPSEIQDDIFHRSFSTKSKTRGLGTYSMMLLAEQYLHGRVGFTSTPEHGTFFTVTLPFSQGGAEHGLSAPAAAL